MLTDFKSHSADELKEQFQRWHQPAYRVDQALDWVYCRRATSWEAMTNLPKALRDQLRARYSLHALQLVRTQGSSDSTLKFLWRLADGALIESVLLPANPGLYGEPSDRFTLCVSTQVGCAYGCKFCASGLDGWKRNLSVDEIVDQVLATERWNDAERASALPSARGHSPALGAGPGEASAPDWPAAAVSGLRSEPVPGTGPGSSLTRLISNLVIMGMGEPLANYDHLLKALHILNAGWGMGIGARKITISTSGLAPQIRKLAHEPQQFRLALSLHGATDEVRNRIMPVNRKYSLAELTAACEYYQRHKGRMITFEYILIAGVNDALEQARPLATLARRLKAKVNLIPYNTVEGLAWRRPELAVQEAFLAALTAQKVSATLRREKGHDIQAACGQLRLQAEREGIRVGA